MRTRVFLVSLILTLTLAVTARAQPAGPRRAGLVVVHGDGEIVTACVTFEEETITGVELLRRSELDVILGVYGGLGYGVCTIDGEGCAEGEDCFCQCRSEPCAYWVYSHQEPDGSWAISGVGAAGWQLTNGDVDGWLWGDGSSAPPKVAFEEICPPEAPPAATLEPSATVERSPEPAESPERPLDVTPEAAPTVEAPSGDGDGETATSVPGGGLPWSYIAFAGLATGLAVLLFIGLQRRR
jgi:hypothetical protein